MSDLHHSTRADPLQKHPHVAGRNRNTAFGRPVVFVGNVEEDGAARSADRRIEVVRKHHDNVVEPVVTPHPFMTGRKRQIDRAIVLPVRRVITPAIRFANPGHGQPAPYPSAPVGPIVDLNEFEGPGRRCAIAFALPADNAGSAERTRNRDRANGQQTLGPITRQGADCEAIWRFFRIPHIGNPNLIL